MSERTAIALSPNAVPEIRTLFEQGLGLFSIPVDAELLGEVVSLACAERRRSTRQQPLAL